MLLLVTLALVVASAVLLILGFVRDALGFIYLSMLCAGIAALALFVFARLNRRRSTALVGGGGDLSIPQSPAAVAFSGGDLSPSVADTAAVTVIDPDDDTSVSAFASPVPAAAAVSADPGIWSATDEGPDWGDEVVFPIEDYDDLRVAEILPLLGQLEPDELQEVRDREVAGKARATILDRIDDRLARHGVAAEVVEAEPPTSPSRPTRRVNEAAPIGTASLTGPPPAPAAAEATGDAPPAQAAAEATGEAAPVRAAATPRATAPRTATEAARTGTAATPSAGAATPRTATKATGTRRAATKASPTARAATKASPTTKAATKAAATTKAATKASPTTKAATKAAATTKAATKAAATTKAATKAAGTRKAATKSSATRTPAGGGQDGERASGGAQEPVTGSDSPAAKKETPTRRAAKKSL